MNWKMNQVVYSMMSDLYLRLH